MLCVLRRGRHLSHRCFLCRQMKSKKLLQTGIWIWEFLHQISTQNWRRKKDQMCINASFTCSHFARQISPTRLLHCIAGQLPPVPPSKCTFRHFHICQITFAYLHTFRHIVNVMRICNGLWCCIIISATLGVSVIALGFGGAPNLTLDRHLLPTLLLPPRPHNNWELH